MRVKNSTTVSMIALALVFLGAPPLSSAETQGSKVRWDIIQIVQSGTTFTALPGGTSLSAASFELAQGAGDDSTISLTGSGTFRLDDEHEVTGGGTWVTAMKDGTVIGSGTYKVTELVYFVVAPGNLAGLGVLDGVGNTVNSRAGLAVLKIRYSDGTKGILVVVCTLFGTPPDVIEGTTATKGFVDYADPFFPNNSGAFGNTLFHIIPDD